MKCGLNGAFRHDAGHGNGSPGQGQNDADLGNHRYFLGNNLAGIGISMVG